MFIKKDTRKIPEILADEGDPRTHLKLARRGAEFADGVKSVLCAERPAQTAVPAGAVAVRQPAACWQRDQR